MLVSDWRCRERWLAHRSISARLLSRLQAAPVTAPNERDPLNFADWTGHDVDLRISVEAARFNGARLSDAALYLLVKKGRFEAGLLRAGAYGGSGKGRALAVAAPGGIELKLQGEFDKLALGQAAAALPALAKAQRRRLRANAALEGTGSTAEEIMATPERQGLAGGAAGRAGGLCLRRIAAPGRPGTQALAQSDWRQGKTGFETAQVTLNVANGEASSPRADERPDLPAVAGRPGLAAPPRNRDGHAARAG